jgi:hypothetical protein
MIKHVLSKTLFPLAAFSLLLFNYAQACTGMDVIITKITFTGITSDTYTYTYEIKNIGTTSVPLKEIALQNYVATDAQGTNEVAAGGSDIVLSSNTDMLAPGDTYTGTMGAYPNATGGSHPQSSYPYLIVNMSVYPDTECDVTNNNYSALVELPATTGVQSRHTTTATVNWNNDTKSFTVKDWAGSTGTTILQYTVISPSGMLVSSGKTAEEQSVILQALQSGMYIIYLSDGDNVYSKKIIY